MADFTGMMEGKSFTSAKPFVMLGWPAGNSAKPFDTENEAIEFKAKAMKQDEYARFAKIYGYFDGKWSRISKEQPPELR